MDPEVSAEVSVSSEQRWRLHLLRTADRDWPQCTSLQMQMPMASMDWWLPGPCDVGGALNDSENKWEDLWHHTHSSVNQQREAIQETPGLKEKATTMEKVKGTMVIRALPLVYLRIIIKINLATRQLSTSQWGRKRARQSILLWPSTLKCCWFWCCCIRNGKKKENTQKQSGPASQKTGQWKAKPPVGQQQMSLLLQIKAKFHFKLCGVHLCLHHCF